MIHPTEKPLALMIQLVQSVTAAGDSVLDPFCGSGSTLHACQRLNRRAVGLELDANYARLARGRLEDAWAQPLLFGHADTEKEITL